jgi:hypothetical protein
LGDSIELPAEVPAIAGHGSGPEYCGIANAARGNVSATDVSNEKENEKRRTLDKVVSQSLALES